MKELHFWLDLAIVSFALALVQLPFVPSRFGAVFFLALGIGCTGEWAALKYRDENKVCRRLSILGRILFALFVASFAFIQIFVIQRGMEPDPGAEAADYVLVLGALVKPDGQPSAALSARCDTAAEFLQTHPGTKAVLCGGQGWNEPRTEASSMYDYMTAKGIASGRLLIEDQSSNTIENIRNAAALIESDAIKTHGAADTVIAVITSDYHLARARVLMRHAANLPRLGIPAPTPYPAQWLSVRCREYCSILGLMLSNRWWPYVFS